MKFLVEMLMTVFYLVFNQCLIFSSLPVLSTTGITEAYEVGDSCYAYIFFTIVAV